MAASREECDEALLALYKVSEGNWRNSISWADIATEARLAVETANQALSDLADAGLIQVEPPQNAYLTSAGKSTAEQLPPSARLATVTTTEQETKPARSKWEDVAVPILRWVDAHESQMTVISVQDLADAIGVEKARVATELDRLIADGYLLVSGFSKTMTGGDPGPWHLVGPRLSASGARATGAWPSGDAGDQLLEAIKTALASEPDPVRQNRLKAVLAGLADVGKNVVTEIAVGLITRSGGLP